MAMTFDRRRAIDVICETIHPAAKRILDVGCGDGSIVRALAKRGAHVVGLEISDQQLERARGAEAVADERYMVGRAEDLPFPDASFDVVLFFNSLHHVPEEVMAAGLDEARRVLVAHGLLAVQEPVADGPYNAMVKLVEDERHVRARAYEEIKAAQARGYGDPREIDLMGTAKLDDFEHFMKRVVAVDPERKARADTARPQLAHLFHVLADRDAEGKYCFDAPVRLNFLTKAA